MSGAVRAIRRTGRRAALALGLTFAGATLLAAQAGDAPAVQVFLDAAALDDQVARPALDRLARSWKASYTAMIIDMVRLMRRAPRPGDLDSIAPSFADEDAAATAREVVTTTWGEWRAAHPRTTVLSLETGHQRDYGEGVAYRDYFATDELYFRVGHTDRRLANKAEVLTLRIRPRGGSRPQPIAIDARLLKRNPVFHFEVGGRRLVVVTSLQGANRVYDVGGRSVTFQAIQQDGHVIDANGGRWRVAEEALIHESDAAARLSRVVAARAFWFGWYAQFPETTLLK